MKSGEAISRALKKLGYGVLEIDVDHNIMKNLIENGVDVVFIALHGRWGEDGTIQGLLELLKIPYTGSGVLASALSINKALSKKIFIQENLPTPEYIVLNKKDIEENLGKKMKKIFNIGLPLVIKPCSEGSTVGTSIVREKGQLKKAFDKAIGFDDIIIVEKYIKGIELTVGILGREAKSLPVVEVIPKSGFYDFKAKYTKGMTRYIVPAQIPEDKANLAQDLALKAHQALGCEGVSRVDMRLSDNGEIFILEVNSIPGMTETSLVPKAAEAEGIDFIKLIDIILKSARLKIIDWQ